MCLFCVSNILLFATMALRYILRSGIVMAPALLLLLMIALAVHGLLCLQMNFWIILLIR